MFDLTDSSHLVVGGSEKEANKNQHALIGGVTGLEFKLEGGMKRHIPGGARRAAKTMSSPRAVAPPADRRLDPPTVEGRGGGKNVGQQPFRLQLSSHTGLLQPPPPWRQPQSHSQRGGNARPAPLQPANAERAAGLGPDHMGDTRPLQGELLQFQTVHEGFSGAALPPFCSSWP